MDVAKGPLEARDRAFVIGVCLAYKRPSYASLLPLQLYNNRTRVLDELAVNKNWITGEYLYYR